LKGAGVSPGVSPVERAMDKVIEIGSCRGCNRRARLDDGVCKECLENPGEVRRAVGPAEEKAEASPAGPEPLQIGPCKGCGRSRDSDGFPLRLDDGVCKGCLESKGRGRKWAEMSHRCRTDGAFALTVYNSIQNDTGRKLFELMYGVPLGAIRTSAGAVLHLVTDEERVSAVMEA